MASASFYITFALGLASLLIMASYSQDYKMPNYITIDTCNETCRLHPKAECRLDCLEGPEEGQYSDCIYHHYYSNGTIEYRCDWD